jgi:hypothetical protein
MARKGDYAASLAALDRVTTGDTAENLAKAMVADWTRLKPETRDETNILVLDNATRLIVNSHIREVLKREGTVAAEDHRLEVLTPSGLTDQEKQMARFYSAGQVLKFTRDNPGLGIARDADYRVVGVGRNNHGRQVVRLVDEHGRQIEWRPGLGKAAHVNVFLPEKRDLAQGDRIQWRLVNKELEVKNAERGTVLALEGNIATIRWDRGERVQQVDLSAHRTWDHGYSETVYSSQSKTYDRVYALAPVESGLVNGQNYYTAITRAAYGVKLWTESQQRLAEKLASRSGEKTSSLEGLGRIKADSHKMRGASPQGPARPLPRGECPRAGRPQGRAGAARAETAGLRTRPARSCRDTRRPRAGGCFAGRPLPARHDRARPSRTHRRSPIAAALANLPNSQRPGQIPNRSMTMAIMAADTTDRRE